MQAVDEATVKAEPFVVQYENGESVETECIGHITLESTGRNYMLFAPIAQLKNEDSEDPIDVIVFEVESIDAEGNAILSPVDDEEVVDEVIERFDELVAEEESNEN